MNTAKTFADMARYLKTLLPAEIPAGYSVKPLFTSIEREDNIRNGVLAFRDFMGQFYDLLIADGKQYEKPPSKNRNPSLAVDYPFIYHARSVLLNIGYRGSLHGGVLTLGGLQTLTPIICCEGMPATAKLSVPKIMECLRFLSGCGMYLEGFDAVKPCMADDDLIEVTYPDNPAVLTGLKIMAAAQRDLRWKTNDEIFLRCDYRALTDDPWDAADALKAFIRPFSSEAQETILRLHQKSIAKGLRCTVKTGLKNSFLYTHKKNTVWELSASFAGGFRFYQSAAINILDDISLL